MSDGGSEMFWSWGPEESTHWFQVEMSREPSENWVELARKINWGRQLPDPLPTLNYEVASGRLAQGADVIYSQGLLPILVGPRFIAAYVDARLTGARFAHARVVDRRWNEESTDYRVLIPSAVVGRRLWTSADHWELPVRMGGKRAFRGYPFDVATWGGEDFVRVDRSVWLLVSRRAHEVLHRAKLTGQDVSPASQAKLIGFAEDFVAGDLERTEVPIELDR